MAKLTVTIPKPVAVFNGDKNNPSDWRIPIVTAKIAAAEITSVQNVRCAVIKTSLIELIRVYIITLDSAYFNRVTTPYDRH